MWAFHILSVVPPWLSVALFLAPSKWTTVLLPLLWFSVIVLTLIIESQTADLVAIWFAPSALVALFLSFFRVAFWVQLSVFVGLTLMGLVLSFLVLRPMIKKRSTVEKTNADALAGKQALVEESVDNRIPTGVVKINGQLWTARMEQPFETAAKGEWVEVVRVEGSKLICRRQP